MSNLNWSQLDDATASLLSPQILGEDSSTPAPDANGDGQYSPEELSTLRNFWRAEILRAQKVRKARETAWRASRRAYCVKHNRVYKTNITDGKDTAEGYTDPTKAPHRVSNAIHYSNVEIIVSNIMAAEPVVKVTDNLDPTSVSLAIQRLVQGKLSYFLKHIRLSNTLMSIIYDLELYNICVTKVGYSLKGTHMLAAPANSPFAVRLSPFQYLVDAEAANQDNARWEAEEFFIDEREVETGEYINVEEARKYLTKYVINPEGNREDEQRTSPSEAKLDEPNSSIDITPGGKIEPAEIKRLHLVDIYDKINRKIITGVLSSNELVCVVKIADIPSYIRSTPYKVCVWNIVPDNFYGVCDYEIAEPKLREIDKIEQRILDYTKAMIPKYAFDKSGVSKDEIEDFVKSEMLACVGIKGDSVPIDKAIIPIIQAMIPRENFQALADLRGQINADLGITDFMRGKSDDSSTATEAAIIDSASKTRGAKRQNQFDAMLDEVVKGIYRAMREMQFESLWINEPGKYPVVAENNGKMGLKVDAITGHVVYEFQPGFKLTKAMLKPYNIEVEPGSTSAKKSTLDRMAATELYSVTKGDTALNPHTMLKHLLLAFGKNPDDFLLTPEQMQPPAQEGAQGGGIPADMASLLGGQANAALPPQTAQPNIAPTAPIA